ncbi:MAG: PEP-CTERM sorting domain-containing protein [Burkholderiaceae bacterium]|nr:PEP-CTERM sorting domain-containing protein [Burkholderiaceae bacterium]
MTSVFLSGLASAAPIIVVEGDVVLFNFDVTSAGASPPPPYAGTSLNFSGSALEGPLTGQAVLYKHLDAVSPYNYFSTPYFGTGGGVPDLLADGMFSVVVSVFTGSIRLDPYFVGWLGRPGTDSFEGTGAIRATEIRFLARADDDPPVATVPEPATLSLVSLVLAGLAVANSRSRSRVQTKSRLQAAAV